MSSLVRGPDGALWLTGSGGVDRFDGDAWTREVLAPGGDPWEWVRRVAFTSDGRVWAAGDRLQERVDGTWIEHAPILSPAPTHPTAYDVTVSPDGPVWVTEGVATQFGVVTRLWRLGAGDPFEALQSPLPARAIGLDGARVAIPGWGVMSGDALTAGLGGVYASDGAVYAWDVTPGGEAWAWRGAPVVETGISQIELVRAEVPGDFAAVGPIPNDAIASAEDRVPRVYAPAQEIDVGEYTHIWVTAVAADDAGAWFSVARDRWTGEFDARLVRAEGAVEVLDDVLPNARVVGIVPDGEDVYVATHAGAVWRGAP